MTDRAEVKSIRDSLLLQDVRQQASELKTVLEYVKHIDIKLDILQADVDELATSLRLHERLAEIERCLAEDTQAKIK